MPTQGALNANFWTLSTLNPQLSTLPQGAPMQLTVSHQFLPKQPTVNTSTVMDHFGIGFETGQHVIAQGLDLPIQPGDVVAFVGASGSGKSSLMRAAAAQLDGVLNIDALALGERVLVDSFPTPLPDALALLSACGLSEAQLLLRTPGELSDGQRYRYRLARGLAARPTWLLADEFTAALDRTLAKVIAFNLRKLATRTGTGFLLATTHTDILDDLQPDLLVHCRLDGDTTVTRQTAKKKLSASTTNSNLRPARSATGRTSLGGITAAITCRSFVT